MGMCRIYHLIHDVGTIHFNIQWIRHFRGISTVRVSYIATVLILGLHPANERRRYFVTTSLIGWGKPRNQSCSCMFYMIIVNYVIGHLTIRNKLIFTRGQFWPSGIVIACVCGSVCPCVCSNHELVRTITHRPFKLGSPNLDQRCKTPWFGSLLFLGMIDLDLQGQI